MQLVLQLTRACNLACTYCYQTHRAGTGMTASVAEAALRWALKEGHSHVAFTYFGGEPLLERPVIESTWPRLREIGAESGALVTAKVSTNGVLLEESFARFCRETQLFVSLSVDGNPAAQDSGRPFVGGGPSSMAVERGLKALTAAHAPFATYQVITPQNASHLAQSSSWLFERGSRALISTLDFGAAWSDEALGRLEASYRRLARLYIRWTRAGRSFHLSPFDPKINARTRADVVRKESCRAGVRQLAIDPEGYFYPCIEFLEDTAHRIGHVETGLDHEAWRCFNRQHGGTMPDACGDCAIRSRCGSNCACLNFRTTGRLREVEALLCTHERLVTEAADQMAARLYRRRDPTFLRRHYDPWDPPLRVLEALVEGDDR